MMAYHESSSIPSLQEMLSRPAQRVKEEDGNAYTLQMFEKFMRRSHCEENYEFWKNCNGYMVHCDEKNFDIARWNARLYRRFIRENSPMECNLPVDIRQGFKESYEKNQKPPKALIYRARQHAWSLMTDAYRQYVRQVCRNGENFSGAGNMDESPGSLAKIRYEPSNRSLTVPAIELPQLMLPEISKSAGTSNGFTRSNSIGSSSPRTPSCSSNEASPVGSPDAIGAGTQRLINKGKEFMSKFRVKNRRPSFASQSSTNTLYTRLERRASDRTLYQK